MNKQEVLEFIEKDLPDDIDIKIFKCKKDTYGCIDIKIFVEEHNQEFYDWYFAP